MIRRVFQNSIQADFSGLLLEGKTKIPLAPQEKILTVVFTDIKGCTALMEGMSVEGFGSLLNQHFSKVNSTAIAYGGHVDMFIGDEAMRIWGAPVECTPHE